MRNIYPEELDPKSKYYFKPYRIKRVDDKWVEEPFEPDPVSIWRCLFVEKSRSGANSSDNGSAYLLKYTGDFAVFRETAMCKPKHGRID